MFSRAIANYYLGDDEVAMRVAFQKFCKTAGSARKAVRQGFTLIEVLISLTLGGFVLTAATLHLVSLGKIWTHDWSERREWPRSAPRSSRACFMRL